MILARASRTRQSVTVLIFFGKQNISVHAVRVPTVFLSRLYYTCMRNTSKIKYQTSFEHILGFQRIPFVQFNDNRFFGSPYTIFRVPQNGDNAW